MGEAIAMAVVGLAIGMLIGGAIAYEKGFQAGVSWARFTIFGR